MITPKAHEVVERVEKAAEWTMMLKIVSKLLCETHKTDDIPMPDLPLGKKIPS